MVVGQHRHEETPSHQRPLSGVSYHERSPVPLICPGKAVVKPQNVAQGIVATAISGAVRSSSEHCFEADDSDNQDEELCC